MSLDALRILNKRSRYYTGNVMKKIVALAAMLFAGVALAGDAPKTQTPVKPVAKAEAKTVLVPKTVYKKETVMVPKTVVKKETVMVAVPVVECASCCEVANVRGRLRDRLGRLGSRVRSVADCDCCN